MKSDVRRSHDPVRQLLYVEWILLGMALLSALSSIFLFQQETNIWLEMTLFVGLAGMGLHLPTQRLAKLGYIAIELLILVVLAFNTESYVVKPLMPLLGMVVVIRSCQMLNGKWRVLMAATVFSLHGLAILARVDLPPRAMMSRGLNTLPADWQLTAARTHLIIFYGLIMAFVVLLVNALLAAYRSQRELAVAHEQLRAYAAKVESQATLQERNRIAREIHDSLGHSLTAQTVLLENALLFLPPDAHQAKDYLTTATESAYQALREVSKSVSTLRTHARHEAPLSQTIPALVKDLCQPAHIVPDYLVDLPESLPEELNLALFRIVQEALTNAVKHSQAELLQVRLVSKSHRLHLQMRDNGKGFDPSKNTSGFGLRGMRERAAALGGTCQIWSAPGAGCRINVILPLPQSLVHPA